jgi:3-(3-hydroxy-phenyl)propionate hydroxylase
MRSDGPFDPVPAPVETDVLLVGLGPVGAAMANLLGRYGVRTLAIDQATDLFPKPRAIALDNEALRVLQWVGVRDGEFATTAIARVQYHSPLFGCFARLNTGGIIDGHPMLVTFHQPELERLLRAKLAAHPGVTVRLGTTLQSFEQRPEGVRAALQGPDGEALVVQARYLVGADGASSLVRRSLGLEFEGETFEQDWLIVDARRVPQPIDHCEFLCDPRRPTPHMVAPDDRQRWEFMLHPGEDPERMQSPEALRALLAPWCRLEEIEIERTAVYRFHAREARAFSQGRCFLVGDAAHVTPPFAGQGLVAGLRDIANLSWKLASVVQARADAAILTSYDLERRPHARRIINLARFLGNLVMPRNRVTAFAVHGAMRALRWLPPARRYIDDLKIKPDNRFDEGLFQPTPSHRRLRAGSAFPQGWVRWAGAGHPVLSDEVLGDDWALIGFGDDPCAACPPELLARWRRVGGRVWQWCLRAQALHLGPPQARIESLDEAVMPRLAPFGWACILRPDRCVFSEGPITQIDTLLGQALARLQPPASPG